MYVVFLAGKIASGKSSVASALEELGCTRIDLDQVSREVLEPGEPCLTALAEAFGEDILDPETGVLDRALLAARGFATEGNRALLEAIELPFIKKRLMDELDALCNQKGIAVVEIPLLDRLEGDLDLADEIVYVHVPREIRRVRAIGRGMDGADFDARDAAQPSDDYLFSHADTILDNSGTAAELAEKVASWAQRHAHLMD